MDSPISIATVGVTPSKVVIDAPARSTEPVDATGATPAPVVPAKVEPAVVEVPAGKDAQDPNLGRAFAALARKDQALRNREDQVKAEGVAVKAIRDALETARTKKDPTALLELADISPSELTDLLIRLGQTPSEADRLAALEQARKDDASAAQSASDKAEKAKLDEQVEAYRSRLADAAKAAGDKFELTLAQGAEGMDLAWQLVDQEYAATKRVMPYEEALSLAEAHYDEEAKKLLTTKKYGRATPTASSESTGARADSAPDVLTNNHVSGGPPAVKRTNLTRAESLAEAARLMESRGWNKA